MNQLQLRTALREKLQVHYPDSSNAILIDELLLNNGEARADLVLVTSTLHGFELKSNIDTLERLPQQVESYNCIFDQITLVVSYRHAYKASKLIPRWWGLTFADYDSSGAIQLISARSPRKNPKIDPLAVLRLLWRNEALSLLATLGVHNGLTTKNKDELFNQIIGLADVKTIKLWVCSQLKSRQGWRVVS